MNKCGTLEEKCVILKVVYAMVGFGSVIRTIVYQRERMTAEGSTISRLAFAPLPCVQYSKGP